MTLYQVGQGATREFENCRREKTIQHHHPLHILRIETTAYRELS